jgi:hypothetical protein
MNEIDVNSEITQLLNVIRKRTLLLEEFSQNQQTIKNSLNEINKKLNRLLISEKNEQNNLDLITNADDWIKSYINNNNPGTSEEIKVGLSILVMSGLEDINNIDSNNLVKINKEILIQKKILGLYNITQNDDISGTADIGIVYVDNVEYFSISQWSGLSKCICNPSGNYTYNMKKHKNDTEHGNKIAYKDAIEFRKKNYGDVPNKLWKRLPKETPCRATEKFINQTSQLASNEWNLLPCNEQIVRLKKILDLDNKLKCNCSGIIYFNKKNNKIHCIYKWSLKINLNKCLKCKNDGIYIKHYIDGDCNNWIIKTQVKYNNGIIEGLNDKSLWNPRIGNPISSWNCVAKLEKIFNMDEITVL